MKKLWMPFALLIAHGNSICAPQIDDHLKLNHNDAIATKSEMLVDDAHEKVMSSRKKRDMLIAKKQDAKNKLDDTYDDKKDKPVVDHNQLNALRVVSRYEKSGKLHSSSDDSRHEILHSKDSDTTRKAKAEYKKASRDVRAVQGKLKLDRMNARYHSSKSFTDDKTSGYEAEKTRQRDKKHTIEQRQQMKHQQKHADRMQNHIDSLHHKSKVDKENIMLKKRKKARIQLEKSMHNDDQKNKQSEKAESFYVRKHKKEDSNSKLNDQKQSRLKLLGRLSHYHDQIKDDEAEKIVNPAQARIDRKNEKMHHHKMKKDKKDKERKDKERKDKERKDKERKDKDKKDKERKDKDKKDKERKDKERKDKERKDKERKDKERKDKERKDKNKEKMLKKEARKNESEARKKADRARRNIAKAKKIKKQQ